MGGRAAQSRRTASRVRVAGVEAMRAACSARFAVRISRVSAGRDPLRSAAIRFDRIARALSRTDRGGGGRGMRGRHTGAGTACERWRHTVTGRRIGGNRMASSVAAVIARPRAGLTIVRVR
ncbi:hypothetical protein D8O27_21500 [Burkholderia mallei]|uniref:Uncharacterized protein n=1 Tax=Burkholderia pseudomallei TaxID=28450 RepID=A0AAX0UHE6_BURPE|nr:hypothetical protein DM57_15940 [Burkholderia mallei]ALB13562.1 hypothetical protein ACT79_23720 [Burkholderia pseudomallei]ALB93886.1 hypothetical protein AM256_09855 [Burkholderia pseudomallei]ALB99955.1 hypothetical protein AM257_09870 [Burkholderia pseudomallei]ALC57163.1 hypothetical protein AMS56_10410 [Burkholderia pseudomallei]